MKRFLLSVLALAAGLSSAEPAKRISVRPAPPETSSPAVSVVVAPERKVLASDKPETAVVKIGLTGAALPAGAIDQSNASAGMPKKSATVR